MLATAEIRAAVAQGKSPTELRAIASEQGMQTLEDATRDRVLAGETTTEEFHRVLASFG